MKPDFDRSIDQLRNRPLPAVPANLSGKVWRSIRLRKAEPKDFLSEVFDFWMADRRLMILSLVAAVVSGVAFSGVGIRSTHGRLATEQKTLGVAVFSESPLTLFQANP